MRIPASLGRRAGALGLALLGGPAFAQTYPFEGQWREGANSCQDGLVLTSSRMEYSGGGGSCRFTSLRSQGGETYGYAVACQSDLGDFASSGTIRMLGIDRFLMRDRLMQGQVVTYDRC